MSNSEAAHGKEEEEEYYDKVLSLLPLKFRNELVFAAITQNGKLVNFRKGRKEEFQLPASTQEVLDVKISVLFSVVKTFEELNGPVKVVKMEYQKHDLVVLGLAADKCLYTLSLPGSSEKIANFLTGLVL